MHTYNTINKEPIILRGYGRNMQNMINSISTLNNEDSKKIYLDKLFTIMRIVNVQIKNEPKDSRKIWDDVLIISKDKLATYSPFPPPTFFNKKPEKMSYSANNIKFKSYGNNIEKLIKKASELTTKELQQEAIKKVISLMKRHIKLWDSQYKKETNFSAHIKSILGNNSLLIDLDQIKIVSSNKNQNNFDNVNQENK